MERYEETVTIPIEADISQFNQAMTELEKNSKRFGTVFSTTISSALKSGKSFEQTLKSLALNMSNLALQAGIRPLENLASDFFSKAIAGVTKSISGTQSGALSGITPFAKGGVVSSPTLFGSASGVGLMGEAGYEAIMPLARGSDGRLGVAVQGQTDAINVIFNVSSPNVESFRKSEAQISTMLARTVGRARRNS